MKFFLKLLACFMFLATVSSYAIEEIEAFTLPSNHPAYVLFNLEPLSASFWEDYYQNTIYASQPRKTALLANKYFQLEGGSEGKFVVDLGTGTGRDSLFFLQEGWNVLALDAEQLAIDILLKRVDPAYLSHLEVETVSFAEMVLPADLDLINASYSLPFCNPCDFPECWEKIVRHLAIGGRFAGQFFGDADDWAQNSSLTIFSLDEMLQLFRDCFSIEYLQIETGLIPCANGKMKYWHVFHVIAKKIR